MRDALIQLLGFIWMLLILIAALQAVSLLTNRLVRDINALVEFCLDVWYACHNAGHKEPDYSDY